MFDVSSCAFVCGQIVSHIDTAEGIRAYDDILGVSDGILISRTYLGLRIAPEKVPLAQKWMIAKANLQAKPIIVGAQLMHSMIER